MNELSKPSRTFGADQLPTRAELIQLRVGDHVRLSTKGGSRFWARIQEVRANGILRGVALDNLPGSRINVGSFVFFERAHVFGIL